MKMLDGKVAVITGGARGIGAGIAKRLASDGARVAIVDLSEEAAAQTAAQLTAAGGEAKGFGSDVADEASVNEAVERIAAEWGGIDILVNNAGIIKDNLLFKMTVGDWDAVMGVHLRGSFLWSRAVQASMVEKKWGRIVNLSSTSAYGARGQANYSAAKAGIQGFTKTLAIELGPFGINVNAIAPGFIATDMTRASAERMGMEWEDFVAQSLPEIPVRRVGETEDIAGVVSFLVSEDSSYVSGQIIDVAGGPAH